MLNFFRNLFGRKNKASRHGDTGASDDTEKTLTAAALTDFGHIPSWGGREGKNNVAFTDKDPRPHAANSDDWSSDDVGSDGEDFLS